MAEKKTGTVLPAGIFQKTTPHEEQETPAGQGGDLSIVQADDEPQAEPAKTPRTRRKRIGANQASKIEGRRLYLSEGVHFRLRMLAYQRGQKLSECAEELLDKALPKWDVNRVG